MKKILTLFTFALLFFNSISAYAFFPKAPAGNAPAFNTADLEKQQETFINDYFDILKDLAKSYKLIGEAVLTDKQKKKLNKFVESVEGSNTKSEIKETNKQTKNTSKEIQSAMKKIKNLDDRQKSLMKQAVAPYLSANGKMAVLVAAVVAANVEVGKGISQNPAQAISIKKTLGPILTLSSFLPEYSKMNIEILNLLISTLEKNGVDMSKEKEAAQSQGAE